jgi:hypothetical protein
MSDINLDETLRALRESAAAEAPSALLESELLAEFRRHHRQKGRRRVWIGIGMGVAASHLIAIALRPERPPVAIKTPPPVPAITAPPPPPRAVAAAATPAPRRRVMRKPQVRPQPPQQARREVGTDFIPIPYAPDFRAEDSAAIVRVKLPRYSLQTVGLPFNPERANERIDADVLMGQDGIARAIRFVH